MKKLLSIIIALVVVLALTVPAMAETTTVQISSGGGNIPIVKCKWEADTSGVLEDADPSHVQYPGSNTDPDDAWSQFNPPMVKNATKTIKYYAVVTDAEDMGNVESVFALVFHPINSPAPYGNGVYGGGVPDPDSQIAYADLFKYKVEFTKLGHGPAQIALVTAANNAHLVKFAEPYDINEVAGKDTSEMNKGTADLWVGEAEIDYEQPGGYYTVRDYAIDSNNNFSAVLENQFLYVETAGIEVDFETFNYGPINLKSNTLRAGDLTWNGGGTDGYGTNGYGTTAGWDSYGASVRNIGNMWTKIKITQNDMGFGDHSGSNPNTQYLGATAPTEAQSNWNVWYNLRLGNPGPEIFYDPGVPATTPNFLGLSTIEELDFSIFVYQGSGSHTGTITLAPVMVPFTEPGTPSGIYDPGTPE